MGDPTQIHQVMMNLCTNAGYAMRDQGGRLTVNLEPVELDPEFTAGHPNANQQLGGPWHSGFCVQAGAQKADCKNHPNGSGSRLAF
jgi:hypothetical protein